MAKKLIKHHIKVDATVGAVEIDPHVTLNVAELKCRMERMIEDHAEKDVEGKVVKSAEGKVVKASYSPLSNYDFQTLVQASEFLVELREVIDN